MPVHSLVVGLPLRQDLRHSRSEPGKVVNRSIQHLFHSVMVYRWSVMRLLLRLTSCDAVVEVVRGGAYAGSTGKVNLKLGWSNTCLWWQGSQFGPVGCHHQIRHATTTVSRKTNAKSQSIKASISWSKSIITSHRHLKIVPATWVPKATSDNGAIKGEASGFQWWSYKQTRCGRGGCQILAEDICPRLCRLSSPYSCLRCGMCLAMTPYDFG